MNAPKLIEFQPTRRGMSLKLPPRKLGKAKIIGWLPVAFSLLPILFGLNWVASIFPLVFQGPGAGLAFEIFMIALGGTGLVPLWFGLKILVLGIAILRDQTYSRLEVTNENLICYESFYGFSFKRKIPSQKIKQLVIRQMDDPPEREDDDPNIDRDSQRVIPDFIQKLIPDDLWVLSTTKKMGIGILVGYPKRILKEAARLIRKELDDIQFQLPSSRVADATTKTESGASNERVKIIDTSQEVEPQPLGSQTNSLQASTSAISSESLEAGSPAEPPADSLLKVTHQDGTDVYEIPAQGWRRGMPIVSFAVFWNVFMLFITLVMIWSKPQNPPANVWEISGFALVLLLFWGVGIGLATWAWNSATRSAMIGVTGAQMFIERKSIFGTKWVEFNQRKIHSISVQNSGASVNDVPIKHLVVETEDQPPLGLFANLANEELHWLAGRLKGSLNFKWKNRLDISTAFDDDGGIIVPKSTRLNVDRGVGPTYIEVPAATLSKQLITLFFFALSLAFVIGVFWFPVQKIDVGLVILLTLFGSIFVLMSLTSFLYASRRWTIVASREQLTITRRWPLGTKESAFEPEDIKRICIGTTGLKTGNQTHYQLVVHTHQKKKAMTLMSSWGVKELKYVAATIYNALELELTPVE